MKSITGTYKDKAEWTFIVRWHRLGKSYSIRVVSEKGIYQRTEGVREKLNRDYVERFVSGMNKVQKGV